MKNYFKNETACRCCGADETDPKLLDMMNGARILYGKPIYTSCMYRCVEHNAEVGGSSTSSHLKGLAVDVVLKSKGKDTLDLIELFMRVGFERFVLYKDKNIIHIDIDKDKPKGIFLA